MKITIVGDIMCEPAILNAAKRRALVQEIYRIVTGQTLTGDAIRREYGL